MKVILDRFEGDFAVAELENGEMAVCPRKIFPEETKEGDVIGISIEIRATEEKRREIKTRMDKMFKD